jgi:hypothetical protein
MKIKSQNTKQRTAAPKRGLSVQTRVKAGRISTNHNQTATGLRVKSRVKAGFHFTSVVSVSSPNHNQTAARRVA